MARTFLLVLGLLPFTVIAQPNAALERLAHRMIGSYTSAGQAAQDTNYLDIELEMVRIRPTATDGIWLYVEQAATANKAKPYRQRIYHLEQVDDSTFRSTVCTLDSAARFVGAYQHPERFEQAPLPVITPLPGCALVLHLRNDRYVGSTDGSACLNAWGKATYATSQVDIGPEGMLSWDRGYNAAHEQVWGAVGGGYRFLRKP